MNDLEFLHTPVLLEETLTKLSQTVTNLSNSPHLVPVMNIVDCTLGGAGHASACVTKALELLPDSISLELIGFDQDPLAQKASLQRMETLQLSSPKAFKFSPVHTNFSDFGNYIESRQMAGKIHFLLADFGVSSPQLDQSERGFSLQKEGPLDMRMNPNNLIDCLHILKNSSEQELNQIFNDYGEEPRSRKLARALVQDRGRSDLHLSNTLEFATYVQRVLGYHQSRVHPATRIFQALRMEVNKEMDSIENLLKYIPRAMSVNGTGCFITFHSLEDRAVKQSFRAWQEGLHLENHQKAKNNHTPLLPWETSKSWGKESPRGGETATEQEIRQNPRSRSARIRTFNFNQEARI